MHYFVTNIFAKIYIDRSTLLMHKSLWSTKETKSNEFLKKKN